MKIFSHGVQSNSFSTRRMIATHDCDKKTNTQCQKGKRLASSLAFMFGTLSSKEFETSLKYSIAIKTFRTVLLIIIYAIDLIFVNAIVVTSSIHSYQWPWIICIRHLLGKKKGQNICLITKCTELIFIISLFLDIFTYLLFLVLYILVFYKI